MKDFTYIITNRMDGDRNIYGVLTGNEGFERVYDIYMEVFEGELEIWKDNQLVGLITPNNCAYERDEFNSDIAWQCKEYDSVFGEKDKNYAFGEDDPCEEESVSASEIIKNWGVPFVSKYDKAMKIKEI